MLLFMWLELLIRMCCKKCENDETLTKVNFLPGIFWPFFGILLVCGFALIFALFSFCPFALLPFCPFALFALFALLLF